MFLTDLLLFFIYYYKAHIVYQVYDNLPTVETKNQFSISNVNML